MTGEPLYSLSEAARRFGKERNHKLLRALIRHHEIPTRRIGSVRLLDEAGLAALGAAIRAWDDRPRLFQPTPRLGGEGNIEALSR